MSAAPRIRILCADDHPMVREGIWLTISRQPDMEVIASAASGEECIALYHQLQPDITVMDLLMGTISGVEATRAIRTANPSAKVIILTMYSGDEDIHQAVTAGASAYVYKNTIADDLVRVIREVDRSATPVLSEDVRSRLRERLTSPHVTPREVQIIELVSEGLRDKEIAEAIGISKRTVYVHMHNILAKLDARDRTEAVRTAVRRGIIRMI